MTSRTCREVQAALPALRDGRLGGWRRRAVGLHLRRCPDCQAEHDLLAHLAALREAPVTPPEGLLEELLAQADPGGVRGRVVGPARGAVSGARPALSAALLLGAAAAGTGLGWGVLQGVRRVRGRSGGA